MENAEVRHLFIYESNDVRSVNLSPPPMDLDRLFYKSRKVSLDDFCRNFVREEAQWWNSSKVYERQVILDGRWFSVLAVEGDLSSKVVFILQKESINHMKPVEKCSTCSNWSISGSRSQVIHLLHGAIATLLDSRFVLLGETPTPCSLRRGYVSVNRIQHRSDTIHRDRLPFCFVIRDFEDAFAVFDRDGTGFLTLEKFEIGLDVIEVQINKTEAIRLFKTMSNNKNKMNYRQFLRFFTCKRRGDSAASALCAGLAKAKSARYFSSLSNEVSKLRPIETERRIRGIERVLAILELHAGRSNSDDEFTWTRSFILVNRKALSRFRRFVFRRLLSAVWSNKKQLNSRNINSKKRCAKKNSAGKSSSKQGKLSLTDMNSEEKCVTPQTSQSSEHSSPIATIPQPLVVQYVDKQLHMENDNLKHQIKVLEKEVEMVKKKAYQKQQHFKREIRKVYAENEKLMRKLAMVSHSEADHKQKEKEIEAKIMQKVRSALKDNTTKSKNFEKEINSKLSNMNTVGGFVDEMRRILNSYVARTEKEIENAREEAREKQQKLDELNKPITSSSPVCLPMHIKTQSSEKKILPHLLSHGFHQKFPHPLGGVTQQSTNVDDIL
jgi:hypothetical protein